MRRIPFRFALIVALVLSAPGEAAQRTFVSAENGSDSNPCTRALPCRTFAAAIAVTDAGGEINTLDPGGYGPLTITKSISIVSGLGEAGVLVPAGGWGMTIDAGSADIVNLRGLLFEGAGTGQTGVYVHNAKSVTITHCVFRNLTGSGITFAPDVSGTKNFTVADTLTASNGFGFHVATNGPTAAVNIALDRLISVDNVYDGVFIDGALGYGTIKVVATDCTSANNGRDGFGAFSVNQRATINMVLSRCTAANNASAGLDAEGGGPVTFRFGGCTVTGNFKTFYASASSVFTSYGDNYINGNADGDPAPPVIATK